VGQALFYLFYSFSQYLFNIIHKLCFFLLWVIFLLWPVPFKVIDICYRFSNSNYFNKARALTYCKKHLIDENVWWNFSRNVVVKILLLNHHYGTRLKSISLHFNSYCTLHISIIYTKYIESNQSIQKTWLPTLSGYGKTPVAAGQPLLGSPHIMDNIWSLSIRSSTMLRDFVFFPRNWKYFQPRFNSSCPADRFFFHNWPFLYLYMMYNVQMHTHYTLCTLALHIYFSCVCVD